MDKEKARIFNFILYFLVITLFIYVFVDYSFIQEIPKCMNSFGNFNVTNTSSYLLKVNGSSMSPSIKDGSECICSKKDDYKINDIIIFNIIAGRQRYTVLHRIIGVTNNTKEKDFISRGDFNNFTDSFIVPEKAILCAVETTHRINF